MSWTNLAAAGIGALASGGGGSSTRERRKARYEARGGRNRANALLRPYYDYGTNILNQGWSLEDDPFYSQGIKSAARYSGAGGRRHSGNFYNDLLGESSRLSDSSLNRFLAQANIGAQAGSQMGANEMNTANLLSNIWSGAANAGTQQGNWQAQSLNNVAQGYLRNQMLDNYLNPTQPINMTPYQYGIPSPSIPMSSSGWEDIYGYGVG